MRKAILAGILAACVLLGSALAENVYDGSVRDADVLIEIPALRQYGGYTCGTTCVQMLMNWLFPYEADLNLATYEELLGTDEEAGTPPESILKYLHESGVRADAAAGRSIDDLCAALDRGNPMLICLQAWSSADDGGYNTTDPSDAETYLAEGHWVICVGYRRENGERTLYFNDPACVGHCLMDAAELDERWIDMDFAGTVYDHYGIEIAGDTAYQSDGAFHMD